MMICQHCHAKEATFYYTSNINGQMSAQHFCEDCAQTLGGSMFVLSGRPQNLFEQLFEAPLFGQRQTRRHSSVLPEAYMPLGGEVEHLRERMRTTPEPKEESVPQKASAHLIKRRELNQLKAKLDTCIKAEEFEQAARLRDEIFKLEQEG